jgi:transcription elongation factor GreB
MTTQFSRNTPGRSAPQERPPSQPNYMTPGGYARLKAELVQLLDSERPEVVRTVAWAASNGDRSENGDYIYGKRRLREIDRRIRYLAKRLDSAAVVDPGEREETDQIFFGATVTYAGADGAERTISIVGIDEVDPQRGRVSWISPIAKALLRKRPGDPVRLVTPAGIDEIEIFEVRYVTLD